MAILGRLSTLVKSNVNDLIDSMQDPAKEIDQLVRDMEDSVREARGEVAQCLAEEKRMGKRVNDLAEAVTSWEGHAMRAVQAGDDALAKEALRRKAEKEADRIEAEKALADQRAYSVQLGAGLKALQARVQDVKLRQGTLREKARAAKRGESPVSGKTAAFEDFERMSGKIETLEAEVGLNDELTGQTAAAVAAERKLREMSEQQSVDDALADLKKKLGG
jgi:Phage shock protein A (IM30), suppresses sigma54-dependent transcription